MVTLTAEDVQEFMEAFFSTYEPGDYFKTVKFYASQDDIEIGRKGFLSALRRLPEHLGANARGTVKQIIDEFAGPKQAAPGPQAAEGSTAIQIDDEFLHNIIKVFLFGVPKEVRGDFFPGQDVIRSRTGNLLVGWSRIIAIRKLVREWFKNMDAAGRYFTETAIRETFGESIFTTEANQRGPWKKFTLPETILVRDTESVKVSVNTASLETNPVAILEQLTQVEHAELVRALVKMLREAAGKPVNSIAPQDDGLVTKEAVSVGPPGGFYDSTKYNGYAYLVPKNAINPKFTYQIRKGESK